MSHVKMTKTVTIIIPVYDGLDETIACIESVLSSKNRLSYDIIVINDASPNRGIYRYLNTLASQNAIQLYVNPVNLGFVLSVNKGIQLAGQNDVILLNSDTRVHGDWVDRLAGAAYADSRIGTVSPLSNNATILSYPFSCKEGELPDDADEKVLDTLCRSLFNQMLFEIPTGVGSCLYIRRDCIDDTGLLDATAFGQGYGEECDFCMRSRRLGWTHTCAADVFVYHVGAVSFSSSREGKVAQGESILNIRYPEYLPMVHAFIHADPLASIRRVLDLNRLDAYPAKRVLMISLNLKGGVERFIRDHKTELEHKGMEALVLRPVSEEACPSEDLSRIAVDLPEHYDCPNLHYTLPDDFEQLVEDLKRLHVFHVEVHHFLGLHAGILSLPERLGLPYDVIIHDYIWFCPRVNLIDASGKYCQEPPMSICRNCIEDQEHYLEKDIDIELLRARSHTILQRARKVLAPSRDAAERIRHHFPGIQVAVRSHPDFPLPLQGIYPPKVESGPLRVAIIGAIGDHKGYNVLLKMARDARIRNLPLQFLVIGYSVDDYTLMREGNVFVTGQYEEDESVSFVKKQQCHIALFLSVWPETWCYALGIAFAAGLYCLGYDIGAIGERIRTTGFGELVALSTRPEELNDRLTSILRGRG